MMKTTRTLTGLFLLAQSLSACSNSQFLKGMSLSVTQVNSEEYINVSTQVSMGNIALAELTIPIQDPHSGVNLGSIALESSPGGIQTITLSLNASSVTNGNSSLGMTLPNGRTLPSAVGAVSGDIVGIPVLSQSRVYVGGDLKSSMIVGFALSISAFDSISVIGNSNIFFQQTFNSSLSGVAGLFTGASPNQSGLAVFARYTAPAAVPGPIHVLAAKTAGRSQDPIAISTSGKLAKHAANTVLNDDMSSSNEQKVYNFMYGETQVVRPQ